MAKRTSNPKGSRTGIRKTAGSSAAAKGTGTSKGNIRVSSRRREHVPASKLTEAQAEALIEQERVVTGEALEIALSGPEGGKGPAAARRASTAGAESGEASLSARIRSHEIVTQEALEVAAGGGEDAQGGVSLRASSRFWLTVLGTLLAVVAIIQGYGYVTGWGDQEKLVERRFNTAQRLTLAKRTAAALKQYEKIMGMDVADDHHRQAMIAMADLLREQQHWDRAVDIYRRLLERNPEDILAAWAGLQIADIQLETGKFTEALRHFTDVSSRFPDSDWDAEARLGMGKVREREEQYPEAIALYQYIVDHYAGGFLAAEALTRIGQCYEFQGDPAAARRAYGKVIAAYPPSAQDKAKARLRRLDAGAGSEGVRRWGDGD